MKYILLVSLLLLSSSHKIYVQNSEDGIDVCSYDEDIDWEAVANAGYTFAILRTTMKDGEMDPTFFDNYQGAKDNGLEVAGYKFSYALSTDDAESSAQNLIDKLDGINLPMYYDLEWEDQAESLSPREITDVAKAFVSYMQNNGYETHIYSNTDWYLNYYYPDELRDMGCNFWIAAYGPDDGDIHWDYQPNVGEIIWQYTSRGSVPGIGGECDKDLKY